MRSFRVALALRTTSAVLALTALLVATSVYALRTLLYAQLDGTLLHLAEVEAAAGAAQVGPAFQFHEGVLLSSRTGAGAELTRYAQLWTSDGRPVARSANLTEDLQLPSRGLAAAREGRIGWDSHLFRGEKLRCVIYPLRLLGAAHGIHLLEVAAPLAPLERTLRDFALLGLALVLVAGVGAFGVGWRIAAAALRPAQEITAQAEAIGDGRQGMAITAHADVDEFARLVQVLNDMLTRLEASNAVQRRFTADASHELRGPLTALRGELDLALKRERPSAEYREVLHRCRDEVVRLSRLATDLLVLARNEAGLHPQDRFTLDLRDLCSQVTGRYAAVARERDVRLTVTGPPAPMRGDPGMLERIVSNLVENALKHVPQGGWIEAAVTEGDPITLTIGDSGAGIALEDQQRLFNRFFHPEGRTPQGDGTGLGLAIARTAAEAHGGRLEFVGNAPGAVFRLTLPADHRSGSAVGGLQRGGLPTERSRT